MNYKFIFLLVFVVAAAGCGDYESSATQTTGLSSPAKDRKITLYTTGGEVVNVWEGHYALSTQDSTLVLKNRKKEVIISGGIWVSEDK